MADVRSRQKRHIVVDVVIRITVIPESDRNLVKIAGRLNCFQNIFLFPALKRQFLLRSEIAFSIRQFQTRA